MTDFNWQTDTDTDWRDEIAVAPPTPPSRRWLGTTLILLLLIILAVSLFYRQIRQRINQADTETKQAILDSHQMVHQLAYNQDLELFRAFISGRDNQWTQAQEQLLTQGILLAPQALGLYPLGNGQLDRAPLITPTITLDPYFSSAEVVAVYGYDIPIGGGLTETIRLEQTSIYRRSADRWLWSPPEPEFWGYAGNAQANYLTYNYLERDAALIRRLSYDIDHTIDRFCQDPNWRCPTNLNINLQFSPRPDSLLAINDPSYYLNQRLSLTLPTPTLVGLPTNEAAYTALARGYTNIVLTALMANITGYACCDHQHIFLALADRQLYHLGLKPWPLDHNDYNRLYEDNYLLTDINRYWLTSTPITTTERLAIYALIDFILQQNQQEDLTITTLAASLRNNPTYNAWIQTLIGTGNLDQLWHIFLFEKSGQAQDPPPIPLPDQEIQVRCLDDNHPNTFFMYYNPAHNQWSAGPVLTNFYDVQRTYPINNKQLLVEGFSQTDEQNSYWRTAYIDHNNQVDLVLPAENNKSTPFIRQLNLKKNQVTLGTLQAETGFVTYYLVDLHQCQPDYCPLTPLTGNPLWSPLNQHTLIQESLPEKHNNGVLAQRISLGDHQGHIIQPIDFGDHPVWLDEETYGYWQWPPQTTNHEVHFIIKRLPATTISTLSLSTLVQAVNHQEPQFATTAIDVGTVHVQPYRPDHLLFSFYDQRNNKAALLLYDWHLSEPVLRPQIDGHIATARFAPNGRWLTTYDFEPPNLTPNLWAVNIYDLTTNQVTNLPPTPQVLRRTTIWSDDSQWILWQPDTVTYLINPDTQYRRPLPATPQLNCQQASWLPTHPL
ncbi:MAG TPA: hypothetical protein VLL52_03340 [Anaerolineae bacterium]|nr:hypothetical protein [Anaerolineae bacterium]